MVKLASADMVPGSFVFVKYPFRSSSDGQRGQRGVFVDWSSNLDPDIRSRDMVRVRFLTDSNSTGDYHFREIVEVNDELVEWEEYKTVR